MTPSLAAVAAGDFSRYVRDFYSAGFSAAEVAPGILQLIRGQPSLSLLLSIGVHGDETAPIELVTQLLDALVINPHQLAINLMIVVGNPAAIALGRRFVEVDLNRLFRHEPCDVTPTLESARARQIMEASRRFFELAEVTRWHLDLHTAIRPSMYPTFAIVPDVVPLQKKQALVHLLAHAGIGAVIISRSAADTFSVFTAEQLGATSATLELGQVSKLGVNTPTEFQDTANTLSALCRHLTLLETPPKLPVMFVLAQEIIKTSDAFTLHLDRAAPNFFPLAPDTVIATDGARIYRVGPYEERIVFPNPSVQIGQRAGLMVVPSALD